MPLPKQSLPDLLGHLAVVQNLNLPHLAGIILLYDTQHTQQPTFNLT